LRRRALLNAGEMFDRLGQRDKAVAEYKQVTSGGEDANVRDAAGKYLSTPYSGN
jgi:hypothetical protein